MPALLTGWAVLAALASVRGKAAEPGLSEQFQSSVQPFVATYCAGCHGKDKHKGDLDLSPYASMDAVLADFRRWDGVREKIVSQDMPPEQAKRQPSADERRKVAEWIAAARNSAIQHNAGDPGIVLARRLNNAEYDYSIRDLTGFDLRPAREFPVDPANEAGFDNSGESLTMSPSLLKKYLEAARAVSEHLVLKPAGLGFAPHPVVTDTDRDKYAVKRIIQFYQRQCTNTADYLHAAWRYRHRGTLGAPRATLNGLAGEAGLSAKYLGALWAALSGPREDIGPLAAVQRLWEGLPAPAGGDRAARDACAEMARVVAALRLSVAPKFTNLDVHGVHPGSQGLVLWRDRQSATNRMRYQGKGPDLAGLPIGAGTAAGRALIPPADPVDRKRYEASFGRFCRLFPDAFYVAERGRPYTDQEKEKALATGRLLSAGFHSQMGYFRDDEPLCELVLTAGEKRELDELWTELDFLTGAPMRQYRDFLWFERADSKFLLEPEFEFARPENNDSTSAPMIARLAEAYVAKARKSSSNEVGLLVIQDHFRNISRRIQEVEKARLAAEPSHLSGLQELAARAYRRSLSAAEKEDLLAFYRGLRSNDGLNHEEAVRDTLVSILMSPDFCFRLNPPPGGEGVRPLPDDALASRLSYFLWSSLPDQELLAHAAVGDLHRPKVLLAQTRRMLQDERIRGLVVEFGGHWLDFRRFEEHNAVDRGRFKTFDNELREAMYREPIEFLTDLIGRRGSVLDCLYGDYTFVNPALAAHYGMPVPAGRADAWGRVDGAGRYGRGGLLPMSVFLTMNAPGLRTSPVKRGYWVVRRLLGERIPAPPPNVPVLPADEANLGDLTLRETLERHRSDKNCAGCHARFDALGLAFEGYGPIGERRKRDFAGHLVETRAAFPGGGEGEGLEGLRKYLRERREEEFLDNLCRKFLAYGLGRGLLLSDELTVHGMRSKLAANGYRVDALVEAVVTSPQFLNYRSQPELTRR